MFLQPCIFHTGGLGFTVWTHEDDTDKVKWR